MKKGNFILKDLNNDKSHKIKYKIVFKKAFGDEYYLFIKFKYENDFLYKKVKFDCFGYGSYKLSYLLESLNNMNEKSLVTQITKCINKYQEDIDKKKDIKKLRNEWM